MIRVSQKVIDLHCLDHTLEAMQTVHYQPEEILRTLLRIGHNRFDQLTPDAKGYLCLMIVKYIGICLAF